jgi:transcriptional regulator GlxA family with amidase domain
LQAIKLSFKIIDQSKECASLLANQLSEKKLVAALGAGCYALMRLGLGKGKKIATSPHLCKKMKALNVDKIWNLVENDSVIIDGDTRNNLTLIGKSKYFMI